MLFYLLSRSIIIKSSSFKTMNTSNKTNAKFNNIPNKPCCKVCKDAGKSEDQYSNHWVKNNQGQVICPTLLSQKCRNCDKSGHTVSHCSELEKRNNQKQKLQAPAPLLPLPKKENKKPINIFESLEINSDSEDEEMEPEKFPVLSTAKIPKQTKKIIPAKFSYASMVAKTQAEFVIEQIVVHKKQPQQQMKQQQQQAKLNIKIDIKPTVKKSWIEMMNEDDSDEENQVEVGDGAW